MDAEVKKTISALELMRLPFPDNQVSQLPKPTKDQNKCDPKEKRNCSVCGGWHHPRVVHLTYVGHAAITDRLLDVDPAWSWEPMGVDPMGLPVFDASGGLWIKLTVNGVTRIGYGNAEMKDHMDVGAREKEAIGDAIRNASMRFGAALYLWHKGDLHAHREAADTEVVQGHFVEQEAPKQLPAADKKVASPPKANGASAEPKSAPVDTKKTSSSAASSEPTTKGTSKADVLASIPEHDADTLKELITSGMKQLGWRMIKLREFYEKEVDPEPFASADTMPLEKMRLLHAKLVEKHNIAPF